MERNYSLMWLDDFKIALIEKDTQKLTKLSDEEVLHFESIEEMKEALFLIKGAEKLFSDLKNETAISMNKLKKNIDFLNATESPSKNKLDIIS